MWLSSKLEFPSFSILVESPFFILSFFIRWKHIFLLSQKRYTWQFFLVQNRPLGSD